MRFAFVALCVATLEALESSAIRITREGGVAQVVSDSGSCPCSLTQAESVTKAEAKTDSQFLDLLFNRPCCDPEYWDYYRGGYQNGGWTGGLAGFGRPASHTGAYGYGIHTANPHHPFFDKDANRQYIESV